MNTINVDLGNRSYPILIGENLLQTDNLLEQYIENKKCAVISNPTITKHYWAQLKSHFKQESPLLIELPDGEKYKTHDSLNHIFTELLENYFDRKSILIALGGGVIGDMTGFAAACYQRGIDFIQIPTTLLSQVDSSVGGKTAINHPLGKNMIGAFHQPIAVISDTSTLNTLPENELSAGLAEVIKYGLLDDLEFLHWLDKNMDKLIQRDSTAMAYAIKRSCEIKADVVARDETEQSVRALLNLGHTFGHAIETFTEYKRYLHGECVGIGMVMAADFSQHLGLISADDAAFAKRVIQSANLPIVPPAEMTADIFIKLMLRDKKTFNNTIRLILLKQLGSAFISADYNMDALRNYLTQVCKD